MHLNRDIGVRAVFVFGNCGAVCIALQQHTLIIVGVALGGAVTDFFNS